MYAAKRLEHQIISHSVRVTLSKHFTHYGLLSGFPYYNLTTSPIHVAPTIRHYQPYRYSTERIMWLVGSAIQNYIE